MIRPVLAALLLIALMACDAAPTPTPTQTPPSLNDYCDQHNGCPWLTPTPRTPTPTPNAEQMAEQVRESRQRTSQLCSTAEQERARHRSMADEALAFSDRIMQDNVITVTEGEQLRERSARLDRQLETTSTAERRCDDAKQRLRVLEDALRRMPRPTATPAPQPTATPTPFYTDAPSGRTPTPRPTATPTSTPTVTPTPSPTPSGPILSEQECKVAAQEHWDAVVPTLVQEIVSDGVEHLFVGTEFDYYTEFSDYPRGVMAVTLPGDIPTPTRYSMLAVIRWWGAEDTDFTRFWEVRSNAAYDRWTCTPLSDQGKRPPFLSERFVLRNGMWVEHGEAIIHWINEALRHGKTGHYRLVLEPTQ